MRGNRILSIRLVILLLGGVGYTIYALAGIFKASPLPAAPANLPDALPSAVVLDAQSTQAEGVIFTVRLKDPSGKFRLGETIQLDLDFTSRIPGRYTIDAASYDRSGRVGSEEFHVEPNTGWSDPLADYFRSYAGLGGGLFQFQDLAFEPKTIQLDLNEWIRFDSPGKYAISITSRRLMEKHSQETYDRKGLSITSNRLEFEVLPADERRAQQQITAAVAALDSNDEDAAWRGARVLRFIGSRTATTEMVRRLQGREHRFDIQMMLGLIGARDRKFVVREMEKASHEARNTLSPVFLRTLKILTQ